MRPCHLVHRFLAHLSHQAPLTYNWAQRKRAPTGAQLSPLPILSLWPRCAGSTSETADPEGAPPVSGLSQDHKRGMACCVHVAWENVQTSPLNLSAYQMDYYMPG